METYPKYYRGKDYYATYLIGIPLTAPEFKEAYYDPNNKLNLDIDITDDSVEYIAQIESYVVQANNTFKCVEIGFGVIFLYLKDLFVRNEVTNFKLIDINNNPSLFRNIMANYMPSRYYHSIFTDGKWHLNVLGSSVPDKCTYWIYANSNTSTNNYAGWATGWNLSKAQNMQSNIQQGILKVAIPNAEVKSWAINTIFNNASETMPDISETFVSTSAVATRTFYLKTTCTKDTTQSGNVVNYESMLRKAC